LTRHPSRRELGDLAGLADGSLPPPRRDAAERRIRSSAWGRRALERQRLAAESVRELTPLTPPGLLQRVENQARAAGRRPRIRARVAFAGAASVALATAAALALVLVPSPSTGGTPSIFEVASIGTNPPTMPAPGPNPRDPALLAERAYGVSFPEWGRTFGWVAHTAGAEDVEGRQTESVTYHHHRCPPDAPLPAQLHQHPCAPGHVVTYTVVSGRRLELPTGGKRRRVAGLDVHLYRDGAHDIAVFKRNGRTCVLSGMVERPSTLLKLASWRAGGAVRF
jgi:hypothetical protein